MNYSDSEFLCHNSDDQPVVRGLFEKLKAGGLTVWFDDESVAMGESFLRGIDKGLRSSSSMAVCVGPTGIGPWQREEIDAAQPLAVQGRLLVIPVLLPDAHDEPDLPIFLNHLRRVDFRSGFTDEGLKRLIGDIKKASDERKRAAGPSGVRRVWPAGPASGEAEWIVEDVESERGEHSRWWGLLGQPVDFGKELAGRLVGQVLASPRRRASTSAA